MKYTKLEIYRKKEILFIPAEVAEWSKTLVQIQVAISPKHTQVQSLLGADAKSTLC